MALVVKDRVQETTTTTGTGTITLDGAVSGFQSFSVIGNANTTYYAIVHQTLAEWEVGLGTYTSSGTTLSRDTILASSNSGSAVNFSAGTKNVFVTYPADKSVYEDASNNVTLPANLSVNGNTTLGDASGDSVTFNAATVSTPNGLNFDSNTFVIDATNNRVGVGISSPGVALDVLGTIEAQAALTQDAVAIAGRAGGTSSYVATITPTTLTASRTITLPNATGTVALLGTAQTFTAAQTLTDPIIIGTITEDVFTITDGAAFEVDPANGSIQLITLGASRTPKATNFVAGESVTLMVNDGTAYTLTWTDATWGSGGVIWVGGSAPTLATTGFTVIEFWKVSTQVYGALVGSVA
jgi:hypothetical protein